jgi:hypothetical protein
VVPRKPRLPRPRTLLGKEKRVAGGVETGVPRLQHRDRDSSSEVPLERNAESLVRTVRNRERLG